MGQISPCLWFDGKAEEAARFYVSLLPHSSINAVLPHPAETVGGPLGEAMVVAFTLAGQSYLAVNGGPSLQFNPTVCFSIVCRDQADVDRLWEALLPGGMAQRCGWLTDRYGFSWQIVPIVLGAMVKDKDPAKARRVTEAMARMTKLDVADLRRAYNAADSSTEAA